MKKIFILKIAFLVLITMSLGQLIFDFGTYEEIFVDFNTYDDIHNTIVSTLCLSCIKLDPVSRLDFVFETGNGEEHSEFVLENLTEAILFIEYRSDVCKACDDMAPIIKDIFKVKFEKEDTLYKKVNYSGTKVNFYHINLDHATQIQKDSFPIYDKDQRKGVPMFVVVTVKYDRGTIKPCYTAAYGTLGLETDDERKEMVESLIEDGIKLYEQNSEGYQYP